MGEVMDELRERLRAVDTARMTRQEKALFAYLSDGKMHTYEDCLAAVASRSAPESRLLAVLVSRLRARLPADIAIRTTRGVGYCLCLTSNLPPAGPPPQCATILALLEDGAAHTALEIAKRLWGERPTRPQMKGVTVLVTRLRHFLEASQRIDTEIAAGVCSYRLVAQTEARAA